MKPDLIVKLIMKYGPEVVDACVVMAKHFLDKEDGGKAIFARQKRMNRDDKLFALTKACTHALIEAGHDNVEVKAPKMAKEILVAYESHLNV